MISIVTLIENLVYKQGLVAEHGLSFYINTPTKKILFDTGQSGAFISNAIALGIDISEVDVLVISHGHYDHTGGINKFLSINNKALIYVKSDAFLLKYHGYGRFIGMPKIDKNIDNRLVYVNTVTQIDNGIYVVPETKIYNINDTHFDGMFVKLDSGFTADEFNDEQFLVIDDGSNINIITACSHRGITNVCKTAVSFFNKPVNYVTGGFHTKESTEEQVNFIADYVNSISPQKIGVCHCTGVEKYVELKSKLKMPAFYNFTGNIIKL